MLLSTNTLTPLLSKYTGTNVSLEEIVQAASDLQLEYRNQGYPEVSVAIAQQQITNGIVTMNVFRGAFSQILVSGTRYFSPSIGAGVSSNLLAAAATASNAAPPPPITYVISPADTANAARALASQKLYLGTPASSEAIEGAEEALNRKMAEMESLERGTNTIPEPTQLILAPEKPVDLGPTTDPQEALRRKMKELDPEERRARLVSGAATNFLASGSGQMFEVKGYELIGNTLLPPDVTELILQPYIGPKSTFDVVRRALTDLQYVYRDRGFVTVSVGLPPQKLTNGIVKVRVFEGHLSAIRVANNHYFSANNVMRALPSLHTNMILVGPVFQAELDRANANQDRQIYPQIQPGREENTSGLRLNVKDRLPLHAKVELNNQSSPGTPDLRVNGSAVYNNLWQWEHSLGVQYGFSPEIYKEGRQWDVYDRPLVANYSAFYRFPLGNPEPIEDVVANNSGSFGYNEATRQFRLPPPSGRTELNLYASRSTVDTGLEHVFSADILDIPGVRQITRNDVQQDNTINETLGFRFSQPLPEGNNIRSVLSGGMDFKTYSLTTDKTNIFSFSEITHDQNNNPLPPIISSVRSPSPTPHRALEYLPLSFRYDASERDVLGTATFGVGLSANLWFTGSTTYTSASTNVPASLHGVKNLQGITGSARSSGHWFILNSSFSQDLAIQPNWIMTLRVDGQWSSEPLISTERFGAGGVASVRGYHEGEVFGDAGFHASIEQQTPPAVLGMLYGREPLMVRGSVYMDFAEAMLLDPQGGPDHIGLWGTGVGGVVSIGPDWEVRLLFSVPLLNAGETYQYQPFFNFALTAQF
jgi:hemolysin activation/secretion protein